MVSALLLAGGAAVLYAAFYIANGLRKNIAAARKTGLPFIVVRKCMTSLPALWFVVRPSF